MNIPNKLEVIFIFYLSVVAKLSSSLYLTQENYAPCSFITTSSFRILDCSSKGLTEVPGVDRLMAVSAFYLDGNPIPSIGPNAFANMSSSLSLLSVTSTVAMDRIDNTAFTSLASLTNLKIEAKAGSENSMNKVNIDRLISGLRVLTTLKMTNVNINELPVSFGGGTNIGNVSFVRTAIATIDLYAFANASNLRFLDLSSNPLNLAITKMNWLGSTENLETVILSSCEITSDRLGQMPSVPKLRRLDLKSNKLARLDTNSLVNVASSLEELVLNSNQISDGSTQGLTILVALKQLVMISNYISAIPPEVKHLQNLELLDLRGTRVAGIAAESFHVNSKLKILKLDYTSVHSFHAIAFERAASLEEFTVSAGSLSTSAILDTTGTQRPGNWSVILTKIPRLKVLSLSGIGTDTNEDGGITDSIWSNLQVLPNLQRLTLEYNKLSTVPDFYLSSFRNLAYINIANNNISRLTSASMHGMGKAQVLLQNNRISYMDNCTLAMYEKLESVSLGGNPFYCSCAMQWLWQRVSAINLVSMQCSQPVSLAGRSWNTLNATDFCAPGETAPNNCSIQLPTTELPTTTPFPYLLEITISKDSESNVRLEANFDRLVGTFSSYLIKYWLVSQPQDVFNTSLIPLTAGAVTLKARVNEQYRYCYVLSNGSSQSLENAANCREFTLTGLASAAVIAISVLTAIIGIALIFVVICLVCKKLRHRQSAQMKGHTEEDPYAYVYPDEKQVGKQPPNQSQFQATLRPESKRFSKRSRPNLSSSRPSLATSTTTLATPRMSSSGFAMQNGARPASGHSMGQQHHHQNPRLLSGGVQPSQSLHSIANDQRAEDQHTQQQLSRSQDHLSGDSARRRGGRDLPPAPRQARSQELVLDVSQAAGRYQHLQLQQYPEQPPLLPPPRSRLPSSTSGQQHPQSLNYMGYSGDSAYLPMSSTAVGYLGESSTDQDQRHEPLVSSTYNAYLPDEHLQHDFTQAGSLAGGVDNSAFQRHEASGYYEMGQF